MHVSAAQSLAQGATVYNLEVDGFHTYFVGRAHAWVHNQNQKQLPRPAVPMSSIGTRPSAAGAYS